MTEDQVRQWAKAGCPVYKAQCSKGTVTFDCEMKALEIARNKIGEKFVTAYASCEGVK